jgi:hypothetical protein
MVKKAETSRRSNPFAPVIGLVVALGLLGVAWLTSSLLMAKTTEFLRPQLAQIRNSPQVNTYTLLFAGAIWFVLLAITFFVYSMLVGHSVDDTVKRMPLPKRTIKKKK